MALFTCSRILPNLWHGISCVKLDRTPTVWPSLLSRSCIMRATVRILGIALVTRGVAFLKSPVGQMFHQFFGENMLRADVCNAVEELGQLLDHTGPIAASEPQCGEDF
ncbi:MAG: hypothetical protein R3C56_26380 [Pirellulaceae bacterium]